MILNKFSSLENFFGTTREPLVNVDLVISRDLNTRQNKKEITIQAYPFDWIIPEKGTTNYGRLFIVSANTETKLLFQKNPTWNV